MSYSYMKKYFVFLFSLLLCWTACKKDDDSNESDQHKVEKLVYDDKNVKGGQILVFVLSKEAKHTHYKASFGPNEVPIMRMDNKSELVCVVPALPSGDYTLTMSDRDLTADLNFTVDTDPNLNTAEVLDDFIELMSQNQSVLMETAQKNESISEDEVNQLKSLESEYKQLLTEINEEEEKELAHLIYANGLLDDPIIPWEFTDSFSYLDPLLYPTDEKARIGNLILRKGVVISSLSYGFFHLAAAPEAIFTKIAAIAMAVKLIEEMLSFKGLVYQITRVHGIAEAIEGFQRRNEIQFVKGIAVPFNVYNEYRPLHKDDSESSGLIANVVPVILYFDETWNKARSVFNRISNWFRSGSPQLESYQSPLDISTRKKHKGNPEYYSIENVTQNVALTLSYNESELVLTANAENPTSFSFDLVFKQDEFQNEVRKTFDAFVKGEDNEYNLQIISGNNQQIRSGESMENIILELRDTAGVMAGQKIKFYNSSNNQLLTERNTNISGRVAVSFNLSNPGNYTINAVYEGTHNRVLAVPINITVSNPEFSFVIIDGNNQTVFKGDTSQSVILQLYMNGQPVTTNMLISHKYDYETGWSSYVGGNSPLYEMSDGLIKFRLPGDELYDPNTDQYTYNRQYEVRYRHTVSFNEYHDTYAKINWSVNGYKFSDLMGLIAGNTFEVVVGNSPQSPITSSSWCNTRCSTNTCFLNFGQNSTLTIRNENGVQCNQIAYDYKAFRDTLAVRNGEPTGNSFFFNSAVWSRGIWGGESNYIKDDGTQNRKLYPRNFRLQTGNGVIRRVP